MANESNSLEKLLFISILQQQFIIFHWYHYKIESIILHQLLKFAYDISNRCIWRIKEYSV